jgi:uncharacterized membrane protein
MESNFVIQSIELIAKGLELLGIAVIALAFSHAIIRGIIHFRQHQEDWFERLKVYIGKSLQLALEFLVAADVIRTVTIDPTREGMVSLGLLILVRTILSWSIMVEIEGCWPWQVSRNKKG